MKRQREVPCNAMLMLHQREVTGGKFQRRRGPAASNPQDSLAEWAETELLRHCSSTYCNNRPPLPRSTIALAFSPDGKLLASTHGDHTVKITCCRTGACLRVLADHERTPWVVKFHPHDSNMLASGSLDSHVRVWDVWTGECSHSYNFGRPISSLDFHADGNELAVASGHRMYMWKYGAESATAAQRLANRPVLMLKTRRSLRAVHFHPQGAPLILTAEVSSGQKSRNPVPLDVTGVVNGVETDERRHRHRPRAHTAARERSQPRDSTAFGEQLSQALRELQASGRGDTPREDEACPSSSGRQEGSTGGPHISMPSTQLSAIDEEPERSEGQQAVMWRELYARRILNPQERVSYPQGAPEWFNQSPFERFLDNRRRFRDLALDSHPEGVISGPAAPSRGTLPPTGARRGEAFYLDAAPDHAPASNPHRGPEIGLQQGLGPREARNGGVGQDPRAVSQASSLRLLAESTAEAVAPMSWEGRAAESGSGPRMPDVEPATGGGVRSSAIDNLVRLAELLEFETPDAARCLTGEAGARPTQPSTSNRPGARPSKPAGEGPQDVLQRISSSGGGGGVEFSGAHSLAARDLLWPTDLGEVIDGRWSGARPQRGFAGQAEPPGRNAETPDGRPEGPLGGDARKTWDRRSPRHEGGGGRAGEVASGRGRAVPFAAGFERAVGGAVGREQRLLPAPASLARPQPVLDALADSALAAAHESLGQAPVSTVIGRTVIGRQPPLQEPRGMGLTEGRSEAGVQATGDGEGGARNGRDAGGHTSRSAGKEVGCHVLVRLWAYEREGGHSHHPCLASLKLAIHNTVLCSDMGITISPCGSFLALCTADQEEEVSTCEGDEGVPLQYQLSVYSLCPSNFGEVLRSRPVKAAHCLTAIQFSPASQHLLLAYGRRDPCLQRNLQGDSPDNSMLTMHTVLEVYRVTDLSIVRVLPSADDEINTAAFHPFMGGGLAYGTKEGRLRILTHSSCPLMGSKAGANSGGLEEELLAAATEASSHTSDDERDI